MCDNYVKRGSIGKNQARLDFNFRLAIICRLLFLIFYCLLDAPLRCFGGLPTRRFDRFRGCICGSGKRVSVSQIPSFMTFGKCNLIIWISNFKLIWKQHWRNAFVLRIRTTSWKQPLESQKPLLTLRSFPLVVGAENFASVSLHVMQAKFTFAKANAQKGRLNPIKTNASLVRQPRLHWWTSEMLLTRTCELFFSSYCRRRKWNFASFLLMHGLKLKRALSHFGYIESGSGGNGTNWISMDSFWWKTVLSFF